MNSTDDQSTEYFDLRANGLGYLNRYRVVSPREGRRHSEYIAVTIGALQGPKDSVSTVYLDAKVCGAEAKELLKKYQVDINDKSTKVMVVFNVEGITPEIYTLSQGKSAGETRVSIKTRLLWLTSIRIKRKGEDSYKLVYQQEKQPTATDQSSEESGGDSAGE